MPNYWSGTNCRAGGWAQVGEPILAAQLLLNGELVNEWVLANPEETPPMAFFLKSMFDSSHFPNGTAVNVTFRVLTWPSGWWEGNSDPDPIVKNKAMMFEDPAPPEPDPVPTVRDLISGKNYSLHWNDGPAWTNLDYRNAMSGSNLIFYAGHGAPSVHTAPSPPGMTPGLYESERAIINGYGLPPFNSTHQPQVNFCHLVACNCGDTSDFKKSLFPYYMGWGGPYLENQALMAYTSYTSTNHRAKNAELVWAKLSIGWTANYTREWIRIVWLPSHAPEIPMSDVDPPVWRAMEIGDLALYCGEDNGTMRLKTVYTGGNELPSSPTTPWYKAL